MASYQLNDAAVEHTRTLIKSRQYVLDSDWGDAQPDAAAENAYLENHTFDDYAAWHLGLTEGATDGTKARYAFVVGDFRRVHRSALIACAPRRRVAAQDGRSGRARTAATAGRHLGVGRRRRHNHWLS